ncbi:MAG: lipoyl synthase [Zoogloeaceae bacterium]|jgi:lipoic acid synthetase|nr:lipoyl synthase [Zoogloeaceae bacterium]
MNSHKQKGAAKTARIPVKIVPQTPLAKPDWIRVRAESGEHSGEVRRLLRAHGLHTVCEEASCPNIGECFGRGTATFMILGDLCTRRCPFCDVGHGLPLPPDPEEPRRITDAIKRLNLRYAVITSVDRDDLRDGGAGHFSAVMTAIRAQSPDTGIEILVPDFRGRLEVAMDALASLPDVFNHNLETVPRLYREVRPGADYPHSLELLRVFRERHPDIPTKSGLMVGLGETDQEIFAVMRDLRANGVTMLTIGQYLAPSAHHVPVRRYAPPDTFRLYEREARALGFSTVASAPMVRSSYRANLYA